MKGFLRSVFFFLPVQLMLLHFRKYQLLILFWLILVLTLTGSFASHFGASSLFLAPEYLGHISFFSMFLLGCAMAVFIMTWHITTFIIHSKRIPHMGATRHAFVVYCINNFILPLAFLVFCSVVTVHFQWHDEHAPITDIILLQIGFYLGIALVIVVSFVYFFRVSRDFFKTFFTHIANPARIRDIIPYDSLDFEIDVLPAHSYISGKFKIEQSDDVVAFHPRVMNTILRRHHRNVIFATMVAYVLLLIMGVFMEHPMLRVPAGASFLLFFSIIMGVVGAFKYFLKSWETLGWLIFALLLAAMVRYQIFDLRSVAYGMKYNRPLAEQPIYDYEHLRTLFTPQLYEADKKQEQSRLQLWKNKNATDSALPPLVVITVSGGGSRSSFWTFRTLQYLDSLSKGRLFKSTVLVTGASGGMIGAAYWRNIHDAHQRGLIKDPYDHQYQANIGKDLLNSIIFSLASVDLISPFNKINIAGYSYSRDRGYAMEQEMSRNTDSILDKTFGYFKEQEATANIPMLVVNGTIVNDGRRLMMTTQPVSYLTQNEYSLRDATPPIDGVDFAAFFSKEEPYNLRLTSALRMNATFPFVLPVVKLPSTPKMDIMDAGLRDNFGSEVASRYLYVFRDWLAQNTSKIIFLEIRDTKENDVGTSSDQSASMGKMLADPLFVIQNKWQVFQSYSFSFLKDRTPNALHDKMRFIALQYVPKETKKMAALNFHLTQQEKEDIYESIYNKENQAAIDTLMQYFR